MQSVDVSAAPVTKKPAEEAKLGWASASPRSAALWCDHELCEVQKKEVRGRMHVDNIPILAVYIAYWTRVLTGRLTTRREVYIERAFWRKAGKEGTDQFPVLRRLATGGDIAALARS